MGLKKKTVVVTSDPLDLIAMKTNVSRSKEKVVVSSDSEGSEADDFSELKKITALLSANRKQEFVKTDNKRVEKKDDEKKRDMSRVKCYNYSEGIEADDFSELKKITALLAKAINRRKFYSKPTNNNLRTSSSSQSGNKKQEFVKTDNKRVEMNDDEKKRDMSR
nr:hypothetical protein [Tanacetum cinerariifolium]